MDIKKIALEPAYEKSGIDGSGLSPVLTCMIHDTQPERRFPAVIVVPGGSYSRCSKREGEPAAVRFYSYGFNAFVLDYSVIGKKFPTALTELAAAVKYIRENAEELCSTGEIIICGFSAGGHLTASLGVYYNEMSGIYGSDVRPDGVILSYPVITSGVLGHRESTENIAPDALLKDKISLEKHITEGFPPAFIWHCADDPVVPVENSLMLATALSAARVPFELHVFPEGGHGIALCDTTTVKDNNPRYIDPTAAQWFGLAVDWINRTIPIDKVI